MSKNTTVVAPPLCGGQKFLHQFRLMAYAAMGVIMVRTREPYRCADQLKVWALTNKMEFRTWDTLSGWLKHPAVVPEGEKQKEVLVPDGCTDLLDALKMIDGRANRGKNPWHNSLSVVHYAHWLLPQIPAIMQCLKEYCRLFSETKQRLVLLVPEEFTLPIELQHDVPILDFELPSGVELREVYDLVMESCEVRFGKKTTYSQEEVSSLLSAGAGMTEMEFGNAFSKAIAHHYETWNTKTPAMQELVSVVMEAKTEVVKRSEVLELMPSGSMHEVGGLDILKEWVADLKACFTEEAKAQKVDVPKGMVCIGPPGCGKTMVAKATASALGIPLIRFDISRVFGSLVGQSEERVRSAMKQLRAMAPCVALVDEVDKAGLGPNQGGGDAGTSKRILGVLLTEMQESPAPIFWIFTANRARDVDSALVRKGRMDEVWAILPPNAVERQEVLKLHLAKRGIDPAKVSELGFAVERSRGFVSAELEAAVKEAKKLSFLRKVPVTGRLIADQLANMKPISEAFAADFTEMRAWANNNARLASTEDIDPSLEKPEGPSNGVRSRRRNLGE